MTSSPSIVLVTHYFPAHRGGVEQVALHLAKILAGCHRITWFSSDCDPAPTVPGIECHPIPCWNGLERHTGLPFPIWHPRAIPMLWRAIGAADTVHVHDYLYAGNLLAWCIARLQRKPILITQHIGPIPYKKAALRGILSLLNRTLGRLVLSRSDRCIFVSPAIRDYFAAYCRFRRPPVHIANGVDSNVFHPVTPAEREHLRQKLSLAPDDFAVLFVGRFVEKKGLPLLKAVVSECPRIRWIFAGHGPLDPSAWGLPHVRVFHDRFGTSLAELYRAADLLVLPSRGEGFPLVVQEAMACGTPALVAPETAAGAPSAELWSEDVLKTDAPVRWAKRIQHLATGTRLPLIRERVARTAHSLWSWNQAADAYALLLKELRKEMP